MNNFMLEIKDPTSKLSFLDALSEGGQIVLIGMGAIFAVLGIIWAVLTVFKMVFTNVNTNPKPAVIKEEPVAAPSTVYTADAEIVAVIAAAIAMAESESDSGMKFRVVSFKRK